MAYWTLDDGSGPAATDSSPSGNHLTLMNGAQWTTAGRTNGGVLLDGLNDYLVSGNTVLNPAAGDFTASAWVWLNAIGSPQAIIAQEDGGTGVGRMWMRVTPANKLSTFLGGTPFDGSSTLVAGAWTHVAVVKAGSTITMYVNGGADGQTVRTVESAMGNIRVGSNKASSNPLHGTVDEVRIYNTALSAQQILQLYQSP